MNPEQTKVEQGGTLNSNSIHDRAGLFFGAFGMAVAFLAIGLSWWAIDKAKSAETQLLLLREDVRELTIELRGKPNGR
jgi:hypothetical protein